MLIPFPRGVQLGAFEASIQAAFVLIGQLWYRRQEQGFRIAGKMLSDAGHIPLTLLT
jgi:hypothetical protein